MICDGCEGQTFTISSVTGRETPCQVCNATGEITPCNNYAPSNPGTFFRNQRCIYCGAKQNDHEEA